MDWDDVRVFLAVAREGSMRAAGRALGLSQPTIARRLAAFEARYGPLHPSLRQGLIKLYGYVTDDRGVQPVLVEEPIVVSGDDARFMLVSCPALTNYLVTLSANSRRAAS